MSIDIRPCHHKKGIGRAMHIECVITSVNYSDYLAETLPQNRQIFDRVTVVTSNDDAETLELCRRLSVPCYATGKFSDGTFNKARGLEHGLNYLRYHDWVAVMDADTVLQPIARHWLMKKKLDRSCIYGIDRLNCVGWNRWQQYKREGHLGHDYNCRCPFPHDLPILDRIALEDEGGWLPLGFFQMWHTSSGRHYPIADGTQATAERTDVAHAAQWDEINRRLIGEFVALHLQAEAAPLGANWKGRTTPRFGPPGK